LTQRSTNNVFVSRCQLAKAYSGRHVAWTDEKQEENQDVIAKIMTEMRRDKTTVVISALMTGIKSALSSY